MTRLLVLLLVGLFFFSPSQLAAISLECAPEGCGPGPTSSGYAGAARARVIPQNSRGSNGLFGAAAAPGRTENNLGSQSYNYAIPILQLPGRNRLKLSRTPDYSSRIWEIDRVNGLAILNGDRDFPSYGFRLDFGFLEFNDTDAVYILTEADGSKRRLVGAGGGSGLYNSDDGSFIQYDSVSQKLRYKNGLLVQFTQYSGASFVNFYKPTLIQDTNGNQIAIAYNTSNRITTITDTLGRVVTYNYTNGLLTSITQAVAGGTKTWATFTWNES